MLPAGEGRTTAARLGCVEQVPELAKLLELRASERHHVSLRL